MPGRHDHTVVPFVTRQRDEAVIQRQAFGGDRNSGLAVQYLLGDLGRISLMQAQLYFLITPDELLDDRRQGITPDIALTAIDADVIKTYVELGLGIGILADIAFVPDRDRHLRMIGASHLFKPNTTRIAIRKNEYLRGYTYDFIELFAPQLTRAVVAKAMHISL